MSTKSPLRNAVPNAVSVCGKILQAGQTVLVDTSAVGPKERALEAKGKIRITSSNTPSKTQVRCVLPVSEV